MEFNFNRSRRGFLTTAGSGAIAIAAGSTSAITTVAGQEENWPYGFDWGVEASRPIDMAATTDLVVTYEIDDLNNQTLLVARDIESGTVEWQESFSGTFFHGSGLTVGDNAVFAGGEGEFTRINLETGSREWTYEIEYVSGKPEYYAGSVFVALRIGSGGKDDLVSLDASTGELNWQTELDGSTSGSPAIIEDTVYYGRNAYQLSDGEILFGIDYGGNEPRFEVFDGTLILTTWEEEEGQENLFAIEPGTSSVEWAQNIAGNVFSEPIRVGDTLYIGTRGSIVYSLDVNSGDILWESGDLAQISEQVAFIDGTVFAATVHGELYGLDSETGEIEWEAQLATEGEGLGPLQSLNGDLVITRDYFSGPDGADRYVIPGSLSRLSTDAEPLPTIEITRDSQTPAAGSEIQFHAEVGSIQESTVYWSIWNDDAVSDDASAEAINLQQDTGTEQTYVPSGTGNHAVTCVLIDQQRPVITYLSESFEVSSSSIPATVFQRAENVANSPFAIAGLGAVAVGIGYTAYQRIRSDTTDRDSTDETQQLPETASNLRADDGSNKSLTVDSHAVITLGDQIEYGNSIHIREGTVDYQTVWAITPVSTGETISSAQATAFVDRITPWTQMDAHSCLLTVYGSGSDPLPWVAVEPGDYRQLSDQVDTFSTNELLSAIGQICEAVHHVHRYGTTYENLTTESVLYTDDDELKLRGVVDQLEESDPWYTAPEEFDGESDEQSVVYRIGLIAYELFTGTLPYKQYPNVDAEEAIEAAELIPPSEQIASLPVDLDEITLRALSKAPADRQETVLHLRDELQAVK